MSACTESKLSSFCDVAVLAVTAHLQYRLSSKSWFTKYSVSFAVEQRCLASYLAETSLVVFKDLKLSLSQMLGDRLAKVAFL